MPSLSFLVTLFLEGEVGSYSFFQDPPVLCLELTATWDLAQLLQLSGPPPEPLLTVLPEARSDHLTPCSGPLGAPPRPWVEATLLPPSDPAPAGHSLCPNLYSSNKELLAQRGYFWPLCSCPFCLKCPSPLSVWLTPAHSGRLSSSWKPSLTPAGSPPQGLTACLLRIMAALLPSPRGCV